MELSIIVTSYKSHELLKVCLNSIRKNYSSSDYELIVSDSETDEEMALMMRTDFAEVKFAASPENIGFVRAVHNGYDLSQGDYVLVLNGDIIVKKGAIEKMMQHLRDNPAVGIVGPKLLNFNDTLQYSCYRFPSISTIIYRRTFLGKMKFVQKKLDSFLMKDFDHASVKEVDWLLGAALMTTREKIKEVGLLDRLFVTYFEDTDWCRRFWEHGYKVQYYPFSEMYHYHARGSAGRNFIKNLLYNRLFWIHTSSAIKYFYKYAGKPLPIHE